MEEYSATIMDSMREKIIAEQEEKNPAIAVFRGLKEHVIEFENGLDEEHELGARLVSFGNAITFHVQNISYTLPNLIVFVGVTDQNQKVRLVQHVSQLSFLLISVPKLEEQPKRIGFLS